MLSGMADASLTTGLGKVMVTGGSGFVGCNLVAELLERGHWVRSFDRVPSPMADHPRLETVVGDICDTEAVAAAVNGVDTIFHTAALIELMGGKSVTEEYRKRSFGVNVEGTKNPARMRALTIRMCTTWYTGSSWLGSTSSRVAPHPARRTSSTTTTR